MPNYCNNYLKVKGKAGVIRSIVKAARAGKLLTFCVPLSRFHSHSVLATQPRCAGNERHVCDWGCKWEVLAEHTEIVSCSVVVEHDGGEGIFDGADSLHSEQVEAAAEATSDECVEMTFLTAWTPPTRCFEALRKKVGVSSVVAYYCGLGSASPRLEQPGAPFYGSWIDGVDTDHGDAGADNNPPDDFLCFIPGPFHSPDFVGLATQSEDAAALAEPPIHDLDPLPRVLPSINPRDPELDIPSESDSDCIDE